MVLPALVNQAAEPLAVILPTVESIFTELLTIWICNWVKRL